MLTTVKKAVFPVAGMGTRFLPATKANPKEMLPVVDKPLIQYAVEEAIAAGVKELIFITSSSKRAIEDHFDSNYELEAKLQQRAKMDLLEAVRGMLPSDVTCIYIRQHEALGLGHAVLCAAPTIGNEAFAVVLADDLIDATTPCLQQMLEVYQEYQASVIAIQQVERNETNKYGIISPIGEWQTVGRIDAIVEKPQPQVAPSTLAAIGRYILTPNVLKQLQRTQPGAGGEIQLTDALASLLQEEDLMGCKFQGTRYDCGSKLGYLQATVQYGLKHPDTGEAFKRYLASVEVTDLV